MVRTRRSRTRRQRTALPIPIGPFVGMRDAIDPSAGNERLATLLRNVYPREPHHQSSVEGRPGFTQAGDKIGALGTTQFIGQFTEVDGTEHTIAIAGGRFYEYSWASDAWTETVDADDFTAASITVSTTARIYAVTFAGEMVFTDGVNTPWSWDGTTGGGLTSLTNAPVAYGPPTVYYSKLFFIKASERTAFVWSEENLLNTGYEAGGYNNAWTLAQTDTNRLTRLLGANEALYVFREFSITQVVGEVTPNFASTGTREAVSSSVGTSAPASVTFANNYVVFIDSIGRPHYFITGSEPQAMWEDFDQTIQTFEPTEFDNVETVYDTNLGLIRMGYATDGETSRDTELCFHHEGAHAPVAAAVFDGYSYVRIGIVKNADGEPRVMHGTDDGAIYVHGTPEGTVWSDGFASGDVAIQHEVHSNVCAYRPMIESYFSLVDLTFVVRSDADITVRCETNLGTSDGITVTVDTELADWDVGVWDTDLWAGGVEIHHQYVGLDAWGLYAVIQISHAAAGKRFQLINGSVRGRPMSESPGIQ